MKSKSTIVLSFSARDLLVRLVRTDASIRGNPTNSAEPLWFHNGRCLESALQIEDVRELLRAGLIEPKSEWCRSEQELYRPSAEGKRTAGYLANPTLFAGGNRIERSLSRVLQAERLRLRNGGAHPDWAGGAIHHHAHSRVRRRAVWRGRTGGSPPSDSAPDFGREGSRIGSSGRTRTYNPSVNSCSGPYYY
jgi:hypothetical protein